MRIETRYLRIFILAIFGTLSVMAAPTKKSNKSTRYTDGVPYVHAEEGDPQLPEMPTYTTSEFEEQLKEAKKRGQRKVAAVLSEGNIEPDFREYRDRFLSLKNTEGSSAGADQLDQILFELEQKSVRSKALEIFAAQLIPLRSFRGFFHKVRPLARKYPVVQSYLVTMAKQMASNVNIFLTDSNSENMKVVFRYISEPYKYTSTKKMKVESKETSVGEVIQFKMPPKDLEFYGISEFHTELDIQNWLATNVLPRLILAVNKLNKAELKSSVVVWDNRIIAGSDTYEEPEDRYRGLGEAERNSILATYHGNIANIYTFNSYSAVGLLALVRKLGHLYGVEEMAIFENIGKGDKRDVILRGASAEERRNAIVKFINEQKVPMELGGKKLFTILPNGSKLMRYAYAASLASNDAANLAWTEIKQRTNDDSSLAFDGAIFRPFTNVTNKSLKSMTSVLRGKLTDGQLNEIKLGKDVSLGSLDNHFVPIRSAISTEVVKINTVKFYFSPPSNLLGFLPDDFEKGDLESDSDVKDEKGKIVKYRNYSIGSAKSWKEEYFKPYFQISAEGRPVSNDTDIKTILRVTNQSWGGLMIGGTLNSVML